MLPTKMKFAALGLVAAVGLGGCVDDYGYGGMSVGYNNGGYYGGYGDGYYGDGYGYPANYYGGYGGGYFGWYGDYYYPGTGYYVYGRDRRPYRWNDQQRRYWEGRRGNNWGNGQGRTNWQGFNGDRGRDPQGGRPDWRGDRRGFQQGQGTRPDFQGRGDRPAFQQGQGARPDFQRERGDRQSFRQENRPSAGQGAAQGRQQVNRGGGRRGRD
ncbi:hypothetical protein [Sphingomonas sp. GB1N7]|uniref:hypothetical protein n=1 Tax=Parasphingomonas caseinilytica TaxID=3096158 RepID=UPI002FCA0455